MTGLEGGWLPPGQVATARFPVVGESRPAPDWDRDHFRLAVTGLVERPQVFRYDDLLSLPAVEQTIDIHCVTGWSRRSVAIRGWPLAKVLAPAGVRAEAAYIRFVAHSERGHDTSLPRTEALEHAWLVTEMDSHPLSIEHGGPLRSIMPGRYFYKSLKWLARIELLAEDCLGYWERVSAYHNHADPWQQERFETARTATAEEVSRLRATQDYAAFRGKVLIRARLGGWIPHNRDLSGLQLKYCSLRKAGLAGAVFRGSNLSLSNLEGADLRNARFEDSDLEGASLAGADLRGARMHRVALSATRFYRDFPGGQRLAARVEGLEIVEGCELLEDQAAFLLQNGGRIG